MKRTALISVLVLLLALPLIAQDEKTWFDTEKCAFCKEFAAQDGLMDNVSHEYHNIAKGMTSIMYINDGYWDEFQAAQKGMQKVMGSMQSGEMPYMCGHCEKIGYFAMKGVTMDEITSKDCVIVIYQSDDPATVAELQAFGEQNKAELENFNSTK